MKRLLYFLTSALLLNTSCEKEAIHSTGKNLLVDNITTYLKDNVSQNDFDHLNFTKIIACKYSDGVYTVMTPFDYDSIQSKHFVALKIERNGDISVGKIINLSVYNHQQTSFATIKKGTVEGWVSITSLDRNQQFQSPILDGHITGFYPKAAQGANGNVLSFTDPYEGLPEVIVVAYVPSYPDYSMYWFSLLSMLNMTGNQQNYFQSFEDYTYGSGGGAGGGGYVNNSMQIDFENDYNKNAIDISKYIKCFEGIPDAGALTSITILTDIPVDNNPEVFFDFVNGSPGHTFIRLNKSNGSQHVQQVIGFYPVNGWKTTIIPDPIDAKFVDNGQHEFNASFRMTVNVQDFKKTLNRLQYLADVAKYDIDEFNCTDLALDLFNQSRGNNPLYIPTVNLPGGGAGIESNTPQGLYQKLKTMKEQGNSEAGNISLPQGKAYEGSSNGPCN